MIDQTQHQSSEDARRARELSLRSTRPPVELPGYETQRLLGRGAFGEVWVAVNRNTGRRVAIKFYSHRGGLDWTLLSREVEKLVYLSADRYVVQLLEVGWSAEPPYYVMEYVENGSLDDYLRQHSALNVAEATELFRELAVGLMHAHGKGVLHCDLKPANVLLDQDHKPRLADFGQSRLSHEQSPALGTLFYMAPEQADMEAIPDAGWDVYALGAILFRMVSGEPPFRDDALVRQIEQASDLPERLAIYRRTLLSAPTPTKHRAVKGLDRALAEIIDRCLAVVPERRFANIQEVLDALAARDKVRSRRPLVLLGFVGPVLLLAIMSFTGLRGYEVAVRDSEQAVSQLARERNVFAAKFAARSIEGEIARYFRAIRQEADDPEFHAQFFPVAASALVQELSDPRRTRAELEALRTKFRADPLRGAFNAQLQRRLQAYLDKLKIDRDELKLASLIALDQNGWMLAAAYDSEVSTSSVGGNYAYRSYFHGGAADLPVPQDGRPADVRPVTATHLSTAFRSSTTGIWKVAVSTPIFEGTDDTTVRGVLALTVSLGDFAYFRSNNRSNQFAVLIDGRPGPNFGVLLQHPLLDRLNLDPNPGQLEKPIAEDFTATKFRPTADELLNVEQDDRHRYRDPLSAATGGEPYRGAWIAALDRVRLPNGAEEKEDMIVLVQERFDAATKPVQELGQRLKSAGLWALGGVIAVIIVLWYIVLRVLNDPRNVRRRLPAPATATHTLSTVANPSPRK